MARHRTHSIAFKRQVVEDYLSGEESLHGQQLGLDTARLARRCFPAPLLCRRQSSTSPSHTRAGRRRSHPCIRPVSGEVAGEPSSVGCTASSPATLDFAAEDIGTVIWATGIPFNFG